MPLQVFVCSRCQERFEELVRGDESAPCPACSSAEVERSFPHVSVRGSSTPERGMGPGPCGSCGDPRGPGACD